MKKSRSLLQLFMIPSVGAILLLALLPFLILQTGGVRRTLESNAVSKDVHVLQNRSTVLQNAMLEQWETVADQAGMLDDRLTRVLTDTGLDVKGFAADKEAQQRYLSAVFPELLLFQQHVSSNGVFLVLADDTPIEEAATLSGFFVRDSEPNTATSDNSDLLMERGSKLLARNADISLDTPWSTDFHLMGKGRRASDAFYYEPLTAATGAEFTDLRQLGYWSRSFILEDHYMDNHRMITYSVPLIHRGTVYGVLGVEVSRQLLATYLSVRELALDLNAGYALCVRESDGTLSPISGNGTLYDTVFRTKTAIALKPHRLQDLYEIDAVTLGTQRLYAVQTSLKITTANSPYPDNEWVLCAFVTEDSIFSVGNTLYRRLIFTTLACAVLSALLIMLIVFRITEPVGRLMNSVRGGRVALRAFRSSSVREVNELHAVISGLTEQQQAAEDLLREEKERYRVAVKSSPDIFFTYSRPDGRLDIVNSKDSDGQYALGSDPRMTVATVHPEDREKMSAAIRTFRSGELTMELRLREPNSNDAFRWYRLTAHIADEAGEKIIGCLHDIDAGKQREEALRREQQLDPVTALLRREPGLNMIRASRDTQPCGMLVLLDITGFESINQCYGMTFGDLLLEQLSTALRGVSTPDTIAVRMGPDELLAWFPGLGPEAVSARIEALRTHFSSLIDPETVSLRFSCGTIQAQEKVLTNDLLPCLRLAVHASGIHGCETMDYTQLSDRELRIVLPEDFGPIVSSGLMRNTRLSTLAMNLLDKAAPTAAVLDLIAQKLSEVSALTDILITLVDREYLVNSIYYRRRHTAGDRVVRVTQAQLDAFSATVSDDPEPIGSELTGSALFAPLLEKDGRTGIAIHIGDNGVYCGSMLFIGADPQKLQDPDFKKLWQELGSVFRIRLIRERHDQSAQAKSDFLSRMSHEIRTPMNGIIGMTEIALKEGQTEAHRLDCLRKIRYSSGYLLGLLNDILDMSKIESGKMQLVEADFDLDVLLDGLGPLLDARISEKHQQLTTDFRLVHTRFHGDSLRLNQVLINLLGNANKYTPEGGHITLCVEELSSTGDTAVLRFAVRDDGIGIAEEDQARIFQSFEQVNAPGAMHRQGTGLGLAISSRLVHMMGSDILLESAPGRGSTFSFTLRPAIATSPSERSTSESTVSPSGSAPDYSGRRILIAEDNDLNLEIIRTILEEDYGIATDSAENGAVAVERMRTAAPGTYDLIIMDIMMPVMNGLDATHAIRTLGIPGCDTVPIVAMSANAFDEDVQRSLASGMNDHLSKPLDMVRLDKTLRRYLAR